MSQSGRANVAQRLRTISERRLSAEEIESALSIPVSDSERAEVLSIRAWFTRRYPTPADRLAYVRRAYQRWTAARAIESG